MECGRRWMKDCSEGARDFAIAPRKLWGKKWGNSQPPAHPKSRLSRSSRPFFPSLPFTTTIDRHNSRHLPSTQYRAIPPQSSLEVSVQLIFLAIYSPNASFRAPVPTKPEVFRCRSSEATPNCRMAPTLQFSDANCPQGNVSRLLGGVWSTATRRTVGSCIRIYAMVPRRVLLLSCRCPQG